MSQTVTRIQPGNEPLRRISVHFLAKLILEQAEWMEKVRAEVRTAKSNGEVLPQTKEAKDGQMDGSNDGNGRTANQPSSSLLRLITGIGEAEVPEKPWQRIPNDSHPNSTLANFDQYRELIRYVLVDVRPLSLFTSYRLKGAVSFPLTSLCCGFTNEPPEMLALRNQPDKYIVCYDDGEMLSRRVAIFLSERDYNNIYILSGGLRKVYELYPEGMVAGTIPQAWTGTAVVESKRNDSPPKEPCTTCSSFLKNNLLNECFLKSAFTEKELEAIAKRLVESQKPKKEKRELQSEYAQSATPNDRGSSYDLATEDPVEVPEISCPYLD